MGKRLTVYMVNDTEYSPRYCEIGNWAGKAVFSPRASINKIISRDEFDKPGIYFLKGDSTNETFDEKIYIGETESIRKRLKYHLSSDKEDFNELIFFISKDELLTKTKVKYLESRLVELAKEAKTAQIININSSNLPTLHEADISDMEYFLEQIKLILPVMGFKFLLSSTVKNVSNDESKDINNIHESYLIKTKSIEAKMIETDQGYIIKKGSEANKNTTPSFPETYKKMRRKLLETKILIEKEDKLEFAEDTVFNSPSAASNIVLGRSSNGSTEWINEKGLSFKDVQEQLNGE